MQPQRISYYRVGRLIGAGGMGEVYLAEDETLNRKVALKILPVRYTQDQERVRRFQREARAASALNHPNIITIYEIGHADSVHYIATEYIEGLVTLRVLPKEVSQVGGGPVSRGDGEEHQLATEQQQRTPIISAALQGPPSGNRLVYRSKGNPWISQKSLIRTEA